MPTLWFVLSLLDKLINTQTHTCDHIIYMYIYCVKTVLLLFYILLPEFPLYYFIMKKTNSGMIEKQIEMIFVILNGECVKIPVKLRTNVEIL